MIPAVAEFGMPKEHIFLSYCHDDGPVASRLWQDLLNAGESVWWDRDILPGKLWKDEIRKAMQQAYAVVVCLSDSVESRAASGVYPELRDAIELYRELKPGSIFIIPVRLSGCAVPQIPIDATRTLADLQYMDIREHNWTAAVQKLLQALRFAKQGPNPPAAHPPPPVSASASVCDLSPPPPAAYLPRPYALNAVGSVIGERYLGNGALRVICGRSGVGKSTLASEFFRHARNATRAQWIDCRIVFERPPGLERCDLIVFDNVGDNHPLVAKRWLVDLKPAAIILTTSSERVTTQARSQLALLDHAPSLVSLDAFDLSETAQFLRASVPSVCLDPALSCARALDGSPAALQVLRELCVSAEDACHVPCGGDLAALLREWLLANDHDGVLGAVLGILATVPFVGMDRAALVRVGGRSLEEIGAALERLRQLGLATEVFTPSGAAIAVLHQAVREAYAAHESPELPDWRRRYRELLDQRLSDAKLGCEAVVTCVDAWIMGWQNVFDRSDGGSPEEKYQRHRALLERLIRHQSSAWAEALHSIPQYWAARIQDPGQESCAIVIGLAHMVRKLPGNRALANTMWLGCRNSDAWARASSIGAAVWLWEKLGSVHRENGATELRHWFDFSHDRNRAARSDRKFGSDWDYPIDFDYLAAVCGLIRLTNINAGLEILESPWFPERYDYLTLSHLAVIVKWADDGLFGTAHPKSHAFRNRALHWADAAARSPQPIQATAVRIGAYILQSAGFSLSPLLSLRDPGRASTYAPDIGNQLPSNRLFEFALKAEDHPRTII
jgi:hypothetical protein